MSLRPSLLSACLGGLLALSALGWGAPPTPAATLQDDPALAQRSAWWRQGKFGMFIHWGVYAVPARGEWYMNNAKIQVKDYEKFVPQFDPVKFNAREWVRVAKDAGMKYIVITSKHHDGFSMFDTKQTNYDIVDATPYKRDPLKALADECRRQGIRLGFYYSVMDWHHPDYLPRRDWEKETRPAAGADFGRYLDYMKGQLRELLTNYGDIGVIWFDGAWEGSAEKHHSQEVVQMIRSLKPNILINDRINLPEDFSTPEQSIPAGAMPNGRLWETCMTLNNNWGYAKDDHNWKSPQDLVQKLCDIASKGGNFLLNVGPTAEGEIPQESVDRLREVGRWMRTNGAAIYGVEKSPFRRLAFNGRCTTKGDRLYLEVFEWPAGGVRLEGLRNQVRSARLLGGGSVKLERAAGQSSSAPAVLLSEPSRQNPLATVVELRLDGAPQVDPDVLTNVVRPDTSGAIALMAPDADTHGGTIQYEAGGNNIGYWTDSKDSVSWTVDLPAERAYNVELTYACAPNAGGTFALTSSAGGAELSGTVEPTASWADYRTVNLGKLSLPAGRQTLTVKPTRMTFALMNLRAVRLTPAP